MKSLFSALAAGSLLVLAGGCATEHVSTTQATDFNRAVKDAATALEASLAEVQAAEVDNQVDAFAQGSQRTLENLNLDPKLSDATVKTITGQFGFLVSYSDSLKSVVTPGTSWTKSMADLNAAAGKVATDSGDAAAAMGEATALSATTAQSLATDAGNVTTALAKAGQGLLTMYGEEKAFRIAAETDPAIQRYCVALEALLAEESSGAEPKTGVAGILRADYEKKESVLKLLATTAAPAHDENDPRYFQAYEDRSGLAKAYAALVKAEKTGIDKVLALRKAVVAIAAAHAALAKKDDSGFVKALEDEADYLRSSFKTPADPAATP